MQSEKQRGMTYAPGFQHKRSFNLCLGSYTAMSQRETLTAHDLGSATGCLDVKAVSTRCSAVAREHPSA